MDTKCPKCETIFRVDPAKVPLRGVRARCSVCSAVFFVGRPAELPEPVPVAPAPRAAPAPAPVPAPTQPTAAVPSPMAPPAGVAPRPAYSRAEAPAAAPPRPAMPATSPRFAAPAASVVQPPRPAPVAVPVAAPPPRKVLNPFLAQDPATKARRLARALISDLVVYHPARRADGLRDGTLKLLFDEEIKKCWDEYTEQVGLDMATSTPYFTEALNEILADGQPVFS